MSRRIGPNDDSLCGECKFRNKFTKKCIIKDSGMKTYKRKCKYFRPSVFYPMIKYKTFLPMIIPVKQ
jgi:hypothetical protein